MPAAAGVPDGDDIRARRSARMEEGERDRPQDQRDEGARDRDRIIYTSALRRLAGVTQVVASSEGAIFHNRLTHTYEVAQIARRLAQFLVGPETDEARRAQAEVLEMDPDDLLEQSQLARENFLDPEVAEAAALAHDLGHPPFGHVAESVLNEKISEDPPEGLGIDDGFEGNAQSFRVVTRLAIRREPPAGTVDTPLGLNLTRATLDAIAKYPWTRDPKSNVRPGGLAGYHGVDPAKKWGAFASEEQVLFWARELHRPNGADDNGERSLEAEIMDWADDIAYAVHDLDDFYRAGLVPLDRFLRRDERTHREFWDGARRRWDGKKPYEDWDLDELKGIFDSLMDLLFRRPLTNPFAGYLDQRGSLRTITARLIRRYILERGVRIRTPDPGNARLVARPDLAEKELALLKELIWQYAILHPRLASQQHGKRAVVAYLFDSYRAAAEHDDPLLPWGVREQLRKEVAQTDEADRTRLYTRTATDIICAMTEQQAVAMYRRFTGEAIGSILDLIVV